jgi:lysylphosphatidylglycerol synthetase-like protein (DUF2156 family)
MSPLAGFWISGAMPVQLLVVLAITFLVVVAVQALLKRIGAPITPFWQVIGFWLLAYALFKWAITPPIPSSLLVTYMGLITVALFVWVSAIEQTWGEYKRYVLDTLTGASVHHRVMRAVAVVTLPVIAGAVTYLSIAPATISEPAELRINHPAPPRTITVQGQVIDLQTARNPFRVTK